MKTICEVIRDPEVGPDPSKHGWAEAGLPIHRRGTHSSSASKVGGCGGKGRGRIDLCTLGNHCTLTHQFYLQEFFQRI